MFCTYYYLFSEKLPVYVCFSIVNTHLEILDRHRGFGLALASTSAFTHTHCLLHNINLV